MAESTTVSMKLLIDTQSKRVLFAEASKDCVDFLFHLLSLPIATVVSLLKQRGMVGSLTNIYQSVQNLNDTYLQSNLIKNTLLNPKIPKFDSSIPLLTHTEKLDSVKKFYGCNYNNGYNGCYQYVSDGVGANCGACGNKLTTVKTYVAPPLNDVGSGDGGFVKGVVTYMIMDDLVINPMSTISSLTLLSKFKVKDVSVLEEKVVELDMDQGIDLLKASLETSQVLTNVFLKEKMINVQD